LLCERCRFHDLSRTRDLETASRVECRSWRTSTWIDIGDYFYQPPLLKSLLIPRKTWLLKDGLRVRRHCQRLKVAHRPILSSQTQRQQYQRKSYHPPYPPPTHRIQGRDLQAPGLHTGYGSIADRLIFRDTTDCIQRYSIASH
jgi:hypothetical protein